MKKCIGVIALILLGIASHADSVWTGNAAVGGVSEFPGRSEFFRAASNSFPAGTVLEVTNPRGGKTARVTVVGRLESPGVFILIESGAAEAIGLPTDHVLPVRVSPVNAAVEPSDTTVHGGAVTEDTDYNPAAGLDDGPLEPRTVVAAEAEEDFALEETGGTAETVPAVVDAGDRETGGTEGENLEAENENETGGIVIPEITETEAEPETIIAYVLDGEAVEETVEAAPESTVDPDQLEAAESIDSGTADAEAVAATGETGEEVAAAENGGKVYFLTPSDLRPPPDRPAAEADGEEAAADKIVADAVVAEETAAESIEVAGADAADDMSGVADTELAAAVTAAGLTYIQIGAFENRAILEDTARRTRSSGLPYPLSVATDDRGGRAVYKLLIGPLRPAERGVVLRTLRSTAYPDAFPYTP